MMYADDTKIWRQMECLDDHITLERDVNYLIDWFLKNKMNPHSSKCKDLMVSLMNFLVLHHGNNLLDYVVSEKDLGITMNRTINFTEHAIFCIIKQINVSVSLKENVIS